MNEKIKFLLDHNDQEQEEDTSIGTEIGARVRAATNLMSDQEREEALQTSLEIIYGQGQHSLKHANCN